MYLQVIHPMLLLPDGYHPYTMPPGSRPLTINISVVLMDVFSVNELEQVVSKLFCNVLIVAFYN